MSLVLVLAGLTALFVILLLVILIVVVVLRQVQRKIGESQHWPSTTGVVLTSEVGHTGDDSGWYTRVIYRYEVGGRAYESSRIAVGVELGDQSQVSHERLASRFPVGARVTVYYNPQNPAEATLIQGDPNSWKPSSF